MRHAVTKFGGIKPRLNHHYVGGSLATIAENVRLWNGHLAPFRTPKPLNKKDGQPCLKTIYRSGCCWLAFESDDVDIAHGLAYCPELFASGINVNYPVTARINHLDEIVDSFCEVDWKRLGMPKPELPVTSTSGTLRAASLVPFDPNYSKQKHREGRNYIYTYVDSMDREGPPSPSMQASIICDDDATVILTIPPKPTIGNWDIAKINIYRSATPVDVTGASKEIASYFLLDTIDGSAVSYIDNHNNSELMDLNISQFYYPPPADLKGLTYLDNGILCGFRENELWFSEPYQFHAFPSDYLIVLDDTIVNIKYAAGALYVATRSFPYMVSADSREDGSREVFKFSDTLPCISKRSMVSTASGVMYASNFGLVRIMARNAGIDTHEMIDEASWQAFLPHRIKASYMGGRYYGFMDTGGFIWDFRDGTFHDGDIGVGSALVTLTVAPQACFTSSDGKLYLSFDGQVCEWDAGAEFLRYRWRSGYFPSQTRVNFSSALITFGKYKFPDTAPTLTRFQILSDLEVKFDRDINVTKPFRLPSNFRSSTMQIEISGYEEIIAFSVSTSIMELVS